MNFCSKMLLNVAVRATIMLASEASAQLPPATAGQDGAKIVTLHAEGAQIYECKPDSGNKSSSEGPALTWQFREPIATLIVDGKSVGPELGLLRWKRSDGQSGRQCARRHVERYPVAQNRRSRPSQQRHPVRCDDRPAYQHQGWGRARIMPKSRRVPQRPVFRGLRVFAQWNMMDLEVRSRLNSRGPEDFAVRLLTLGCVPSR
jgi:hypothetical protein